MDTHSLGLYLKNAREEQGLTLDDAVQSLKIQRRTLNAFEQGDFTLNASPVQIRGFLRIYAGFLGLDDDLVIQYYESATQPQKGRRRKERPGSRRRPSVQTVDANLEQSITDTHSTRPQRPDTLAERRKSKTRRRSRLVNGMLVVLLVVISLAVIIIGVVQFLNDSGNDLIPSDIANLGTNTPLPTIAPTFTLSASTVLLPEFQQDFDGRGIALTIQVEQRTWMRVVVDGIEQVASIVSPQQVLNFRANREILVRASNASGLVVFYNGQLQGSYGERGQEVEVQYLPDSINIITGNQPSPTPLPTSTSTPPLPPTDALSPTPSSTEPLPPSPTPLPGTGGTAPTGGADVSDGGGTTSESTDAEPQPSPTPSVTATEASSPVPTAVLPPRITPTNPTPTKSAS